LKKINKNWWWLEDHYWQANMKSVMDNHLKFIDKQKEEVVTVFYNTPIKSTDGVYHPIEGSSTHFIGNTLFNLIKPKTSLLEIGCGTGALSCISAKLGVSRIVATDISASAYACTKHNIKNLGLESSIEVLESNLFSKIPKEKFDYIVFNPPLLHCSPISHQKIDKKEYNDIAIDHDAETTLAFIDQAKPYLKKGGELLLLISNIGNRAAITQATDMLSKIGEVSVASASYSKLGDQWRFVLSVSAP
jgi:release factor glutamine methyltransferase